MEQQTASNGELIHKDCLDAEDELRNRLEQLRQEAQNAGMTSDEVQQVINQIVNE